MITERDLQESIAYYQGIRDPDINTCIKLASCLTILEHMHGANNSYSNSSGSENVITYNGDSEFASAIRYKKSEKIWPIIDEVMSTLQLINPQLHDTMMKKIREV